MSEADRLAKLRCNGGKGEAKRQGTSDGRVSAVEWSGVEWSGAERMRWALVSEP